MGNVIVFLKFGLTMFTLTLMGQCSQVFQGGDPPYLEEPSSISEILMPAVTMFFFTGIFGVVLRFVFGAFIRVSVAAAQRNGRRFEVRELPLRHIFELDGNALPIKRKAGSLWRREA